MAWTTVTAPAEPTTIVLRTQQKSIVMANARRLCLSLGLLIAAASPVQVKAAQDAQARSFSLPGDGGWDYVAYDPSGDRVFLGRSYGVQVVAARDGHPIGTIGAATGAHGAVFVPKADRVFTSDGRAGQLGVFVLSTLRKVGTVPLPGEPDGLVADPATGHVLALLPEQHLVVAVDPSTAKITGTVDVGDGPEAGVSDGAGAVFLTMPESGDVVRLNTLTMTVDARWRTGCERPSPVAIDGTTRRLFVGCQDQRLLVMSAMDGHTVATARIGEGADAVTFDPNIKTVAVASGAGGISLVRQESADRYAAVETIDTPRGTRTMALDPATGRLFTVTADIASVEPATTERPYPLLHSRPGTFRLIEIDPAKP